GDLQLEGEGQPARGRRELVLVAHDLLIEHAFELEHDGADGRIRASVPATSVSSLAEPVPLRQGFWELFVRPARTSTDATGVPVMLAEDLQAQLPIRAEFDSKPFALGTARDGT